MMQRVLKKAHDKVVSLAITTVRKREAIYLLYSFSVIW
jgi:hypothetical protein